VLPRPEGQRCLVVAGGGRTVSRTRAGRLLRTFPSALPGGARGGADAAGGPCILDCVFHEPDGAYYVQDLMCWKGYALYDCSAEFRLFWLASKLGESGAGAPPGPRHRFPFLPVAAFACDPGAPPAPARGAAAARPAVAARLGRAPHRPCRHARRAAARAGGLHAALRGAVPFVRDGVALLHKEGHYALGATPLALLWKDARCSRFHLDTDAAGAVPALQPVTLQCLPGGAVGTGDERPVALGRVPEAAAQQLGERLRRATALPLAWKTEGHYRSGCSQMRPLREAGKKSARPAHVLAGALQHACALQASWRVGAQPVRQPGGQRTQAHLPHRPGRLLRFALAGGGLDMGPDGCPTGADLRYEGPANQRRAKADTLSKVRLNVFFRALRLSVHR